MESVTLLAEPGELEAGEVEVAGDAYRHLFRARRLPVGAAVRVVDGLGNARWGKVARVDRGSARIDLEGAAPGNEPELQLDLLVPTLRPERASWLVEKATEIGIASIRFYNSARAPRTFGGGTIERLRRIAAGAVEQCHRARLPEISGPHEWDETVRLAARASARWILDPDAEMGGWGAPGASGALLVGPEGGWTPAERQDAQAAGWRPVGLGPRVLRIETAAVTGAALLLLGTGSTFIDPAARSG